MQNFTNEQNALNGIKCEVKDCEYHANGDCCTAHDIKIGCHSAMDDNETCCDTFCKK